MKYVKDLIVLLAFQSLFGLLMYLPYEIKKIEGWDDLWFDFIYIFLFLTVIVYSFIQEKKVIPMKRLIVNFIGLAVGGIAFNVFMTFYRP